MDTVTKRFRLGEYVKDGHLAQALRNELAGLKGEELTRAQEAIMDVAATGIPGSFEQLLDTYRQAIARELHPERKLLKDPKIDRKIVRNPKLAEYLDTELVDVTAEELAAVNAALKAIFDEARTLTISGKEGTVRTVQHDATPICMVHQVEHPTVPAGESKPCGYFRGPEEWREVLRLEVRKALKR